MLITPCRIAPCPTVTRLPISSGEPEQTLSEQEQALSAFSLLTFKHSVPFHC